ncbi:phosphomannomutase/phosphoglucomutase [Pseudomonas daroniae]|uniref:Phosphomannomutase/phosphoglucomutase n=2 Tax=Pseudomonadales TaxID=72274 RepID=A0A4Q9QHG8_9GAMM|nr:phosphomannomutase/phosphoglucomutase [Pseudomonas daroniae]TBU85504.1 phosphomannomutase/phosphoglucomutase [Pseudomonas sp. FRB 228]TBU94352.1 phosphomannomutase/phosphoglucomutase [Pseudomonas daroniae]
MKGFKRSPKEERSGDSQTISRPKHKATTELLPGALAATLGVVLAGALLWVTAVTPAQQRQQEQLTQAWGKSQAASLQQALKQLSADTLVAARNPELSRALQSGDEQQLRNAEQALRYWNGVVDAQLNLTGQAVPDSSRTAPMNFAALDMLRRLESGQAPAVEAYRVGERWLAYSVAPVRQDETRPMLGTLLLAVDLNRVLANLPPLPADVGQIQLVQRFDGGAPQVLTQRGQADGNAQAFATGNPHWTLNFTPASSLGNNGLSPALLALALLVALAGALAGLYLVNRRLQQRLKSDISQLTQLVKELSAGKAVKAFSLSLPALHDLAQNLSRLPRRAQEPAKRPDVVASQQPSSSVAAKPADLVNPLFQDTDILDIDILDDDQDLLGLEQTPTMTAPQAPKLPADIFRAYDIRGVVGAGLTPETAYWIGRAIGSQSQAEGEPNVSVGRDGRLSGPVLVQQLIQGLVDSGCQVSDVGMVPTPVVYYAAHVLAGKSAVMLTGSHNPPDYNGFKIVIAGDTLANEQIQALKTRIDDNDLVSGEGSVEAIDLLPRYLEQIRNDIAMAKPLRVVVDCGNGAAGVIAPQLIEALGCKVIPLYCEVDGNFPNHHPDPGKPENLVDLIAKVKEENADIGLAFDGDGDRVGVVTNTGAIVYPDRLLMLFAKDVVSRNPGADIIFDVKCTRRLTPLISGYGGRPVMWKTGHSLIKKKMKETGALLAGEMSGHVFFKERWFGFDDGIYAAARLLEILSQDKRTAEQVFAAFPNDVSTPELNIQVTEQTKFPIIERLQREGQWGEASVTNLDGVRVDYPKGWGLVRASNTTPVLVLRFEAENQAELERIQELFRSQLRIVAPDIKLPF